MKKEVQILPPAPVTTPSSFQASVSSPLFCLFPLVLVAQSTQHAILHSDLNDQTLFHSTIDMPQVVPVVSKNPEAKLKSTLVSWSAKIQPKLIKI